jgi:hypothetical protein
MNNNNNTTTYETTDTAPAVSHIEGHTHLIPTSDVLSVSVGKVGEVCVGKVGEVCVGKVGESKEKKLQHQTVTSVNPLGPKTKCQAVDDRVGEEKSCEDGDESINFVTEGWKEKTKPVEVAGESDLAVATENATTTVDDDVDEESSSCDDDESSCEDLDFLRAYLYVRRHLGGEKCVKCDRPVPTPYLNRTASDEMFAEYESGWYCPSCGPTNNERQIWPFVDDDDPYGGAEASGGSDDECWEFDDIKLEIAHEYKKKKQKNQAVATPDVAEAFNPYGGSKASV